MSSQAIVYNFLVNQLVPLIEDRHFFQNTRPTDLVYVSGPPGSGKTTVIEHLSAHLQATTSDVDYVFWLTTAVAAARANEIGGTHIHELFSLRVTNGHETPQRTAEKACRHLRSYRPDKIILLRRLRVLIIDEIAVVSGELLVTLHLILQQVRGIKMPFGGLCVVGTGDEFQTEPVSGTHPLLTTFFREHFFGCQLCTVHRGAQDGRLVNFINKWRDHTTPPADLLMILEQAARLVAEEEVPPAATWYLATNVEVDRKREQSFERVSNAEKKIYLCHDVVVDRNKPKPTTSPVHTRILDRQSGLRRSVALHVGATVNVVRNLVLSDKRVFNGSQGVITSLTDASVAVHVQWPEDVGVVTFVSTKSEEVCYRHKTLTRSQLPLESSVANTVHFSQGRTAEMVATMIQGSLWTPRLLYTLITRVKKFEDLYLVDHKSSDVLNIIAARQAAFPKLRGLRAVSLDVSKTLKIVTPQVTAFCLMNRVTGAEGDHVAVGFGYSDNYEYDITLIRSGRYQGPGSSELHFGFGVEVLVIVHLKGATIGAVREATTRWKETAERANIVATGPLAEIAQTTFSPMPHKIEVFGPPVCSDRAERRSFVYLYRQ